jgi:prepilin-type N-terminal cleavage/methylation domain-containing protein
MAPSPLSAIRRRLAGEAGFTLTEMIIVLAILGIVIGAMTQLFVSATNAQLKIQNRFNAQQNARLALDSLRREIHCASAVTADGTASATLPASKLVFTLGSYCPSNTSGATAYAVWCTRPLTASGAVTSSGTRNGIFRYLATSTTNAALVTSSNCGTSVTGTSPAVTMTAVKKADYLTVANVFVAYVANSGTGTGSRAKLTVDLPVNVNTLGNPADAYDLKDDIVLRNTSR